MCSKPQKIYLENGPQDVQCRKCQQCLNARRADWIARALAEKSIAAETLSIELTYRNNEDGTLPDAAKAFRYKDYQRFMYRLRKAYKDHYKTDGEIRYLVAGERGSQKGRVHWHVLLFADRPITVLGDWTDFHFEPWKTDGPKLQKMNHWTMWDHGHVMPKTPNYGGMAYVVKYVLKDQFNIVASKGKKRFTKAELDGAGMFRMSKKPPIGYRFLEKRLNRYEEIGAVPTSLKLTVEGLKGFWWPTGKMREYMLARLHLINERVKQETGQDCPQWSALLASTVEHTKDWEGLVYGEIKEKLELIDRYGYLEDQLPDKGRTRAQVIATTEPVARLDDQCGTPYGCKTCHRKALREDGGKRLVESVDAYKREYDQSKKEQSFLTWFAETGRRNPYCQTREKCLQTATG